MQIYTDGQEKIIFEGKFFNYLYTRADSWHPFERLMNRETSKTLIFFDTVFSLEFIKLDCKG